MDRPREVVCRLIDNHVRDPDPVVEVPIRSGAELERTLRGYAGGEPRVLSVLLPEGMSMTVGIGGDLAGVYACPVRNPPPGAQIPWTAQARGAFSDRPRAFMFQDHPLEFPAAALMPLEEVIGLVLHFVEHHELPGTHVWLSPQGVPYRGSGVDRGGTNGAAPAGAAGDIPF
jgi:hypothetical protein